MDDVAVYYIKRDTLNGVRWYLLYVLSKGKLVGEKCLPWEVSPVIPYENKVENTSMIMALWSPVPPPLQCLMIVSMHLSYPF